MMAGVVLMAIFGDHGLVRRHDLRQERMEVERRAEDLARQNVEMRREIRLLESQPLGIQRLVAEELLMASSNSTIYRFSRSK
jgi:cell division protein FtsB